VTALHRPARLLAGLFLVTSLVLAGCSQSGASASPVATTSVNLPPSYKFDPPNIVVHVGDKVTWTNNDHFTHSVRLLDDGGKIMIMQPGQSVSFTFTKAGVHHYDCSFHPQNMQGTVLVE
jgi:plastocyanin